MTELSFFLGTIGMACILFAFLMVQMHKWNQDMLCYDFVNMVGAILLLFYALDGELWPFVILNAVWLLYSLRDVIQDIQRKR